MKTYSFPAVLEPGDEGGLVVSFPDVPEAITQGADAADARAMGADALGVALLTYLEQKRSLPSPSRAVRGQVMIDVDPDVAAKLAVIEAFRDAGITKTELASRLGKDEREIRRILDPDHATRLPALTAALAALGRRLVVSVAAA